MSADDLLEAMGRTEATRREREPEDERWEALTAGRLSTAEAAELKAAEPDLYELFRPLDADARESVHEAVEAVMPPAQVAPEPPAAEVISLGARRPRWTRWLAVAAPLAAAAVLLLMLRPGASPEVELPGYTLQVGGALAAERGAPEPDPDVRPRFAPTSNLELVITPERATTGASTVLALRRPAGGAWSPWSVKVERAPSGSARITGPAGELLGTQPQRWDLLIAIGPADARPATPEAAAALADELLANPQARPAWRHVQASVELIRPH